jgi:hypothetical protein
MRGKENVAPDNVSLAAKKLAPTLKKAVWLTVDDAAMIQVLTEQQVAGNQSDNGWKSLVWTLVAKALQGSEELSGGAAKTPTTCSGHWGKVCGPLLDGMDDIWYTNANL